MEGRVIVRVTGVVVSLMIMVLHTLLVGMTMVKGVLIAGGADAS
jgi:hypothetical protein